MQKFFPDAKKQNLVDEDAETTLDIVDITCLTPDIKKYLEQPFEIICESLFCKCDIRVDMQWYYGFRYFILKTLQTYLNFWFHYCF